MFLPFKEDTSFEFHAIGISHWRTPLSVREQFSISSSKLIALFNFKHVLYQFLIFLEN